MHRQFRELLEKAEGVTQQIIAINLDIRGFTPFCQGKDSFDVGSYITKVYIKIIDGYFSDVTFYKPTGDGLLIVVLCNTKVKATVNKTIDSCLKLLEDFGSLCQGDDLIYFSTPDKIGVGMARGSACCVTSESKTLDYSGKVLNLASRLMDMARPSGIIFDSSLGIGLLSGKKAELFSKEDVYIRGIAEEKPVTVYYTKEHTLVSDIHKHPLKEPRWESDSHTLSLKELKLFADTHLLLYLKKMPLDKEKIFLEMSHISPRQKRFQHVYLHELDKKEVEYKIKAGVHFLRIAIKPVLSFMEAQGVTDETKIQFIAKYPTK